MATIKIAGYFWFLFLSLTACIIESPALNAANSELTPQNISLLLKQDATVLDYLQKQNKSEIKNEVELNHYNPNQFNNSTTTENKTHGARLRRAAQPSSVECQMSKNELYKLYSTIHTILSTKTQVSKIPSFQNMDCSVGFQNILTTASNLVYAVNTVSLGQKTEDSQYIKIKAEYAAATKAIQNQVNSLEKRKNEKNPEIQAMLGQINELTRQRNVALEEKRPLTNFQAARLGWLQTMRRCTTSKRKRREFNTLISVPTFCKIPTQQLNQLQTLLHSSKLSILSTFIPESPGPAAQPQSPTSTQNSCAHIVQSVQSQLTELKDAFKFAVTGRDNLNAVRRAALTRLHKSEVTKLTGQRDNLTISINQKHAATKGAHQNTLQILQQEVSKIRTKNGNLRKSEKQAAIHFAGQLVRCKENTWAVLIIERAATALKASNSPLSTGASEQLVKDVVAGAYSRNLVNLEKVLNFAYQLPTIVEIITAHEAIYEEMRKQGHLGSPQILLLAHQVDGVLNSPGRGNGVRGSNEQSRLRSLEAKLSQAVNGVLRTWASNINSWQTSHILQFPRLSVNKANAFNHYLPRLVQTAYGAGRLSSVAKLLKFGGDLHWYSHQGTVLSQLFKAMKRHGDIAGHSEIFLLAYKVKEALGRSNAASVIRESQHLFQGVKNELPSSVRAVMWNSWVKIWSRQWDGYTLYGSKFGNIYTYPNDNYRGGRNQHWTVYIEDSGRFFRFQNRENGKFLYGDSNLLHAYSGKSSSYSNQRWVIIPETNNGDWLYIRNRATDKYLDASRKTKCVTSRECCCSTVTTVLSYKNPSYYNYFYQQWKFA